MDTIIQGKTRTKREFCSYYTESDPILTYMVSRLNIEEGDNILEPCAGDGVFIKKITTSFPEKNYDIEALDLNPKAIDKLNTNFQQKNISIRQADTLLDLTLDLYVNMSGHYTKIIGNPPYGAFQSLEKRATLKKIYGGYAKETYTLFIQRGIDLLKENGKLVFIVPDTFLALHAHKGIRERILKNTKIDEIVLIPSNFFPGVNFGYSNLCIISVTKTKEQKNHKIKILKINKKIESLYNIADLEYSFADDFEEVAQEKILNSLDYAFFIGGNTKIRKLINESKTNLGDLANCVTGFCSGENTKFYKPIDKNIKNTKNYEAVNNNEIEYDYLQFSNILKGLENDKRYIPLIKGGNGMFKRISDWFILWDKKTVNFYQNNKKSRFQNSKYYFKEGLGVPMVGSSKLKAFLLEKRIFDQSIVGIFPKEEKNLYYLLAFLNSDVCNRILKVINHTANNSANYLKKLPVIIDEKYFDEVNEIVENIFQDGDVESPLERIDEIFNIIYQID
jgi:tRNA1(Val) A37 N6-methylase TrmN6